MKTVFRLWKMLESFKNDPNVIKVICSIVTEPNNWIVQMEGLTKDDFIKNNYGYRNEWFVEECE